MRDGSEDWVKIVHDSLIIVHFASGEHTEIYHLHTSKKVKTFSGYYLPDEKEEFLYSYDYSTGKLAVKRTSLKGFQEMDAISLEVPDGLIPTKLFKLSKDGKRIAVAMNSGAKLKVLTLDLTSGKVVSTISGYKKFDEYENKYNPAGKENGDFAFLDINSDGSKILVGNKFKILLYNTADGKKLGTFEENPQNQREDFSNTFFSRYNDKIFISSKYKIYTCSSSDLSAEENIITDGQKTTFRTVNQYGTTIKSDTYFFSDFDWSNLCISADGHYMFSICIPSSFRSDKQTPYIWRFDIPRDGNAYYFYYR
ncbi:MAG: hypothetical protein K2X86_10530 [Cytophagaceae bacterium]|nr:hypothetical protein [Cytophagaceae bacterium]